MNSVVAINHRARSSEQKALRRHAVLETAEMYFKEVGYEAFSMGQLAKASRTYWTIMAAIFFLSLGLGGLMIHFVPILLDVGFTASAAVKIAGVIGIAVVLGRLLVGFAVDRIFAPRVAIAILIACISGVLALAFLGTAARGACRVCHRVFGRRRSRSHGLPRGKIFWHTGLRANLWQTIFNILNRDRTQSGHSGGGSRRNRKLHCIFMDSRSLYDHIGGLVCKAPKISTVVWSCA